MAVYHQREYPDIYKLNLGEECIESMGWTVKRVSGGWIYTTSYTNGGHQHVFVPYNEEFKKDSNG